MRPRNSPVAIASPGSDLEIAALGGAAFDPGAMGPAAELFERQRIEAGHRLRLQFEPQRPHHLMTEGAAGRVADRVFGGFEVAHGAHDVAEADAAALACKPIAAGGAADADEDAVAHQLL